MILYIENLGTPLKKKYIYVYTHIQQATGTTGFQDINKF